MTKQQQEMMMLNESYPNIPIVNTRPDPIHFQFQYRATLYHCVINIVVWFLEHFVDDRKEPFVIKLDITNNNNDDNNMIIKRKTQNKNE